MQGSYIGQMSFLAAATFILHYIIHVVINVFKEKTQSLYKS